jgi:2-octaprenyl-6-methoxyphenol hydroxylase
MHAHVAVVGGGPVGAAAALELAASGAEVLLLEAREARAASVDARPLALSHGSGLILERLGVWSTLHDRTPIDRIHISQRGGFGRTVFTASEAKLPALGYVVDYTTLASTLDAAISAAERAGKLRALRGTRVISIAHESQSAHIRFETATGEEDCSASVVVVADGNAEAAGVDVRTIDYGQTAIAARVRTDLPQCGTAYERFTHEGPLALLPFGKGFAVVWVTVPQRAEELCSATAESFLAALQDCFGDRVGRFTGVDGRAAHALTLRVAESPTVGRAALIGNSAQALHPVAGQGLNLGLRDAWELAVEIRKRGPDDPDLLRAYAARRQVDRFGGIGFTHSLVKIFSNASMPLSIARGVGLALLDNVPPAKDFVVRRMIFGARG